MSDPISEENIFELGLDAIRAIANHYAEIKQLKGRDGGRFEAMCDMIADMAELPDLHAYAYAGGDLHAANTRIKRLVLFALDTNAGLDLVQMALDQIDEVLTDEQALTIAMAIASALEKAAPFVGAAYRWPSVQIMEGRVMQRCQERAPAGHAQADVSAILLEPLILATDGSAYGLPPPQAE